MTDPDALAAACLAEPDDDTVRLVYADALDETGRHDRAEVIRLMIRVARVERRLGRPVYSASRGARRHFGPLVDRMLGILGRVACPVENGVLVENRVGWLGAGLAGARLWPTWCRGFVEAVTCPAADWLACGDALTAAHPVAEVTLTTFPGELVTVGRERLAVWTIPAEWTGRTHGEAATPGDRWERLRRHLRERWPRVRRWHLPQEPARGDAGRVLMNGREVGRVTSWRLNRAAVTIPDGPHAGTYPAADAIVDITGWFDLGPLPAPG